MNGEPVAIIVMDHPENPNHPTHWHAGGYGLFSANAFGSKTFTNNREELNFFLPAGESVTFRHRIIIQNGFELSDALLKKAHVFITPGGIFGSQGRDYIRVSLCSKEPVLEEAARRVEAAFQSEFSTA